MTIKLIFPLLKHNPALLNTAENAVSCGIIVMNTQIPKYHFASFIFYAPIDSIRCPQYLSWFHHASERAHPNGDREDAVR